jgi:hypothetical protein
MYKEGYNVDDIRVRASHKSMTVTINSYIDGHRKEFLEQTRTLKTQK